MSRLILIRRTLAVSLAVLVCCWGALRSQEADDPTRERIRFNRFSVEHGLSHPRVNCIHQDRTGFMWFGTEDGLNRFDGHEFLVFRPEAQAGSEATPKYMVNSIHEDAHGFLWLGETSTGFSKFDPASLTFVEHYRYDVGDPDGLAYKTVSKIHGAPDGALWLGTAWMGLQRFDPATRTFAHYPLREPTSENTCQGVIYSIYSSETDPGTVWLGTRWEGLVRLDADTGSLYRFNDDPPERHAVAPPGRVGFITEASPGYLWVAGGGRLYRFDVEAGRFLEAHRYDNGNEEMESGAITAVLRDREGRTWASSSSGGLAQFHAERRTFLHHRYDSRDSHSLSHNLLGCLYRDRGGVIWVATQKAGLCCFDPMGGWIQHHQIEGPAGRYSNPSPVQCFYQETSAPQFVWLGSGEGLTKWNRQTGEQRHYRHRPEDDESLNSNAVLCLRARGKGGFWIGTLAGLNYYDPGRDRVIRVQSPASGLDIVDDPARGRIWALHEDRSGELWIGRAQGVLRFNPDTGEVSSYRHDPGDPFSIGPGWTTRILEDRAGRLWFGHHVEAKGIARFERETGRFVRYLHDPGDPRSLNHDVFRAFHEDSEQDVLWIGTELGLDRLEIGPEAEMTGFDHVDLGPSRGELLGIEADDSGHLWISTESGLLRMDGRNESSPTVLAPVPETRMRLGDLTDSCYPLLTGEILLGSKFGFFEIRPEQFHPGNPPPVIITGMQLAGTNEFAPMGAMGGVSTAASVSVSHEQNRVLNFQFAALDFANLGQRRYSYRLEGLEEDWSEPSGKHTATYTTLPAGEYRFRVRASNGRGVWNEEGATMAITVLPPWWATVWFRGGTGAVLGAIVLGIFWARNRAHRNQIRLLEEEAEKRATLNRELRKAEERFKSLVRNSSEQVWCVDFKEPIPLNLPEEQQIERILQDGYYSEANEVFARSFGATAEEVIGWPVEKTLRRSLPTTIPLLRNVVRSGYAMVEAETVEVAKDSTQVYLSNSFTPVTAEGKVLRIWGTARDITKRTLAEREIRRVSDFHRAVLDSMHSQIAILDREGIIIDVNGAWEDFARANGASPSEVGVGASYLEACHDAASRGDVTAQRALEGLRSVLSGARELFELEYPCHSPTESRWFWLRAKPMKRAAQGVVVSHVNISELRQAQQALAQQRDELAHLSRVSVLGEVSGSLAHELNQPLGAILANAQAARRWLALAPPNLEETRAAIEHIVQDDKRAGEIVHRVRALAKRDTPDRELLDVNRVASETAALLHSELVAADVRLTLDLKPDLPAVRAGHVELQQSLLNLMLNGLQAQSETDRSRRDLTVTTGHEADMVIVAVRDRGPGISPDIMPRLFDAFFTTKPGGIGLGLAFCQRIAETHSGQLRAANHPDGGAVFSISLPVQTSAS